MTRFTENEKVMLSRAKMPATVTTDVDTVGAAFGGLVEAVRRPFRHASIVRELTQLDDRMLADIGVPRWDIDTVANNAATAAAPSISTALGRFVFALGRAAESWHERRSAFRELSALDDRMLKDIGITRSDIPSVVAAGSHDDVDGLPGDGDALEAFRRWNRSRVAAKEVDTLDDRMLSDVGTASGVVEDLAARPFRPANRNAAAAAA